MSVKVRRLLNIISSKLSNFANEEAKIQRIKGSITDKENKKPAVAGFILMHVTLVNLFAFL